MREIKGDERPGGEGVDRRRSGAPTRPSRPKASPTTAPVPAAVDTSSYLLLPQSWPG